MADAKSDTSFHSPETSATSGKKKATKKSSPKKATKKKAAKKSRKKSPAKKATAKKAAKKSTAVKSTRKKAAKKAAKKTAKNKSVEQILDVDQVAAPLASAEPEAVREPAQVAADNSPQVHHEGNGSAGDTVQHSRPASSKPAGKPAAEAARSVNFADFPDPEPEEFELTTALKDVAQSLDLFKRGHDHAGRPPQPEPQSRPKAAPQTAQAPAVPPMPVPHAMASFQPALTSTNHTLKLVFAAGLLVGLFVGCVI